MHYLLLLLLIAALVFAWIALEQKERINSLFFLILATSSIGLLYIYVGAIYSGVFQLLVYSGVLTVLFAATSYFVAAHPWEANLTEGDGVSE